MLMETEVKVERQDTRSKEIKAKNEIHRRAPRTKSAEDMRKNAKETKI